VDRSTSSTCGFGRYSTIEPPRSFCALALLMSVRMPMEAMNVTLDRSTSTLALRVAVSSGEFQVDLLRADDIHPAGEIDPRIPESRSCTAISIASAPDAIQTPVIVGSCRASIANRPFAGQSPGPAKFSVRQAQCALGGACSR
jgi:hypothetical protein